MNDVQEKVKLQGQKIDQQSPVAGRLGGPHEATGRFFPSGNLLEDSVLFYVIYLF